MGRITGATVNVGEQMVKNFRNDRCGCAMMLVVVGVGIGIAVFLIVFPLVQPGDGPAEQLLSRRLESYQFVQKAREAEPELSIWCSRTVFGVDIYVNGVSDDTYVLLRSPLFEAARKEAPIAKVPSRHFSIWRGRLPSVRWATTALASGFIARGYNTDGCYLLYYHPITTEGGGPLWIQFKKGTADAVLTSVMDVVKHYGKSDLKCVEEGIFVFSKSYPGVTGVLGGSKLAKDGGSAVDTKSAQSAEVKHLQDLVDACRARGIRVWRNLSANINGDWELLVGNVAP